jgi:sigma-B regulation protein RsbU (phosphoserine phosphatase)
MKSFQSSFYQQTGDDGGAFVSAARVFGFDYAGVFSPAQDLRSTVLEKHALPSGKVVFAIGDTVLVPDPLPAVCVRHYLSRSLRENTTDPVVVAGHMNQLIYDCCAAEGSLSCFYAEYDRYTRTLSYVNAGHDAPLLVRRNPDEVLRLDQGGPVFGLKESSEYSSAAVKLRGGDRLVAFTQGVVDSLAALSCRSAENVLVSLARKQRVANAFQLASRIMAECEGGQSACTLEKSVFVAAVEQSMPPVLAPVQTVELVLV